MKNTITTLLDGCRPEELDGMLNDIDPPMPDEANAENISSLAAQKAGAAKRADHRRIFLAAACIALVSCYVAEKVEYDSAVKFFNLNEFDTDGMSRDDIKRVWRDFTTERFSYDESYQLLENSRDVTTVRGADISILNSTNNHLSFSDTDLWSRVSRRGADYLTNCDVGSGYDSDDKYQTYYENAYIEKYVDGAAVWEAKFKRPFYINGYTVRDGRVLVWGDDMYDTRDCLIHTAVALLDDADGTILWEQTLDSEYSFDEYAEAAFGEYGRIAVLTAASDMGWGSRPTGQTVAQRPQRRQAVWIASACSLASSAISVSPLFCFWIGTSRLPRAMPIIGPPIRAFFSVTPLFSPPACSSSSENSVPSRTIQLPGLAAASPVSVSVWAYSGSR